MELLDRGKRISERRGCLGVNRRKQKKGGRKNERKEKGVGKKQRPTCLKSMKASSRVSPWKPGTGPALANPVGKREG